jgi:16S rRNA (cytosine967-C5)-methyltransferase
MVIKLKVSPQQTPTLAARPPHPKHNLAHLTGATLWQAFVVSAWVSNRVAQGQSLTTALLEAHTLLGKHNTAALRGASQDLAYAAQRQRGIADALIHHLIKKPVDTLEPALFALLRVVLAVLADPLATPYEPHTAVDQAVRAVPCVLAFANNKQPNTLNLSAPANSNTQAVAGFVNAVLRTFLRERAERMARAQQTPSAAWNHPDWWIIQLKRSYPKQWQDLLRANNQMPAMTLRVNARVHTLAQAQAHLAEHGIETERMAGAPYALTLKKPLPVALIPQFDAGWYSVQDAAAQASVDCLRLENGLKVLDACAAPGGKTAHILETFDVQLTAIDSDPVRLNRVQQTLDRIAHTVPSEVLNAVQLIADDAGNPSEWWDGQLFDRILLDAPCSASGVVRRHPDIRWLRRDTDLSTLQRQQERLLHALWGVLKPNGYLLYVTCSVFEAEGELQISRFCEQMNREHHTVERHPSLGYVLPIAEPVVSAPIQKATNTAQSHYTPLETFDHDGFYYALLQKMA